MRFRGALLVAILTAGLFSSSSALAESNDTLAGASGPIRNGVTYQGVIATENDVDWWVFYTGTGTQLDIALLGLGPDNCFGPVMGLYDSNGQVITQDDYPANRNETHHILRTVDAGTFYVKVEPYNIAPCFGSEALYHLWINSSPALLAGPPALPPPPTPPASASPPEVSSGCRTARQRVATLKSRLRKARSPGRRASLRSALRRARATAAGLC